MALPTQSYIEQVRRWPEAGRHILAHVDENTIVVYQAYRPEIGQYAIRHQQFGGESKYSRMSWIKPNFLWMMYRSDWGRAEGQQVVLGIRLRRSFFDSLLEQAVSSSFVPELYPGHDEWKQALRRSTVRLQWDPDHLPTGESVERRAIQLGLRDDTLKAYGTTEVVEILDMSDIVAAQRQRTRRWKDGELETPVEHVYRPTNRSAAANVGLDD